MCEIWEEILIFISHLVMHIQTASLKLCSLPTSTWNISVIYNMSAQKQTPSTISPARYDEAQDMEGGYVILTLAQNFISTSETLAQIEMWAIWNSCFLVFNNIIKMEHTILTIKFSLRMQNYIAVNKIFNLKERNS